MTDVCFNYGKICTCIQNKSLQSVILLFILLINYIKLMTDVLWMSFTRAKYFLRIPLVS